MNINNYVDILIPSNNENLTIKLLKSKKINLYKIKKIKNEMLIKINVKDIDEVMKLYEIKIVKYYGIRAIIEYFKKNYLEFIILISFITLSIIYSNIIVDISIHSTNKEINKLILLELDKQGIHKYSLKKSEKQLAIIKETILKNQGDIIEWINIENKGMKYVIKVELRVEKEPIKESSYCNIIAKKDGMITRVITRTGNELVESNTYVYKGDKLISGDITYNEEIKNQVCSKGEVYANTWYTIDIVLPKTYENIVPTKHKKYNLEWEYKGIKHQLFKDKYKTHQKIILKQMNILGLTISLIKEQETKNTEEKYSEEELENELKKQIKEKMDNVLGNDGKIVEQKTLKKNENNSKIELTVFIVAEEQIGITSYT